MFALRSRGSGPRAFSSTCVPKGQNLDHVLTLNMVVEVVMNSSQMKPPHLWEISVRRSRTDVGLRRDELKSTGQLPAEHSRCYPAVLMPPTGGFADLTLGEGDDP